MPPSRPPFSGPWSSTRVAWSRSAGVAIRPHDVDVSTSPDFAGAIEGSISRMVRVGFEVRLTVLTVDGEAVSVVLSRTHARRMDLAEGATVWVTAAPGATVVPSMRSVLAGRTTIRATDQR